MAQPLHTPDRAKRHQNAAIHDDLLFGRQTEHGWLTDRLDHGEQFMVLYGPARIGKTALLRYLVGTLAHRYVAVYLDVGKAGSWDAESPLLQIAGEIGRRVREQTAARIEPPEAVPFAAYPLTAWQDYLNALSAQLKVNVRRDGRLHQQEYRQGIPQGEVTDVDEATDTGTTITFVADAEIFGKVEYSFNGNIGDS